MPNLYKPINPESPGNHAKSLKNYPAKGYLLLWISVLFNVLSFAVILGRSYHSADIFSKEIFFGDRWYNGLDKNPVVLEDEGGRRCVSSQYQPASPPAPVNIWASLTPSETADIQAWLTVPERNLNLTRYKHSAISDNVVFLVETYYPPKQDALAYLEDPGHNRRPERYARVVIHHGGFKDPFIRDYLVGPLPINSGTNIRPLVDIYHRENIPFNVYGMAQIADLPAFLAREASPMNSAMEELFGGSVRGLKNDTLVGGMSGPFSFDGSFRRLWMTWRRAGAGAYLLPVNFYQYIDVSGTDPSQWKTLKLIYHGQIFPSVGSFLEAFNNGTLKRHTDQNNPTLDTSWTQRKRVGPERDLDNLPGPRSVSFSGLRFKLDREQGYLSWMGWGMYLGFDRDMGLNFWDIRFRGERIIYQLAPQEAIAQYSGNDPIQTTTAWLDRYFGMGGMVRDMIPHYDCPQEAVYLPATTFTMQGNIKVRRAVCIFEQDTGKPLSRHFGFEEGEFGAVKSYVLTVRSISTVGNYDYCWACLTSHLKFDYSFYLDGSIEVRMSASGYMQGGYYTPTQEGYGGRIRETSMGNLHDHVINYKVDFDISGTANSLLKTMTKQEDVIYPWLDDDWGQHVIQQKITKEYITNEDAALLKYFPNFQSSYAVVNKDATNSWGVPKGYAVHPGSSAVHNTVVGSKRLLNNANWARYNLAVSLRKETEPSSSSMWNLHLPGAPMVDFHKFFDGENLIQEDLVAWINLGMHHLPQAEDSPNTKTNIATSSFILTPLNYFDSDVSMEMKNAILLHPPKVVGGPYIVDNNGIKQDITCLPEPPSTFEYSPSEWSGAHGESDSVTEDDARRASEMFLRVRIGV